MPATSSLSSSFTPTGMSRNLSSSTSSTSNSNSTSSSSRKYEEIAFADVNKWKIYSLMPLGRLAVASLLYPATLIKTRLQAPVSPLPVSASASTAASFQHAPSPYNGTWDAFRTIARQEGVRALYKGFWINMIGLPIGPIYITTLETTRDVLSSRFHPSPSSNSYSSVAKSGVISFVAGGFASIIAQSCLVPLDVIAQRIMVQRNLPNVHPPRLPSSLPTPTPTSPPLAPRTAMEIVRSTIARDGIKGLWRGYGLSVMLAAPMSSTVWSVYTIAHNTLRQIVPLSSATLVAHQEGKVNKWTGFSRELVLIPMSAFIGSSFAAILTQPLDVIKTRIQLNENRSEATFRSTWKRLLAERGVKGLYVGLSARILSMAPASAMLMTAYELLKRVSLEEETQTH